MRGIFVIITVFIVSCNNSGYEPLKFNSSIEYFDKKFVDHFPDSVPIDYSRLTISHDLIESHPFVWLKFFESKEVIEKLKTKLRQNSIEVYCSNDTCLIVIDKHLDGKNWKWYDKQARNPQNTKYKEIPCSKGKMPVPNFYLTSWRETERNLTGLENYKMYLIEAKPGVFMDSKKLPNGRYTPEGWAHGYSKGVAINESEGTIIYWADIW